MRKKQGPESKVARAEVASLRARLAEAEQTLDAIRSGAVDALVIAGPEGERVYTLEGEDYRYRRLIETMKEGAAIVIDGGAVVYANQRLAEMLGVPLPRLLASNLGPFVSHESREMFQTLMRRGAQRASKAEISFDRDGTQIPTYVSATPNGGTDGGVCVVVTDLTEQKRSEEILAAERLATSILEQAAEAVVVCDPEGRVVRASRAATLLAGESPLLRAFDSVFPLRLTTSDPHDDLLSRALRGELVSGAEATLANAENGAKHLVVSAAPLKNVKQETIGCVVSLTDVTERKRAEDGMQLLGRVSAALAGSLNVPTTLAGLVSVVVPAFADLCLVYTADEARDKLTLRGAQHVDGAQAARLRLELAYLPWPPAHTALGRALASGTGLNLDPFDASTVHDSFIHTLSDYGARSILVAPLCLHRNTLGVIAVGRSDSDEAFRDENLRILEELAMRVAVALDNARLFDLAQKEKERVEEANRTKDEFLAVVSHELRTPLNSILGWARMLRSHDIKEEKRERGLETIERNAVIQARLIDDLLDISRIVSGKLRVDHRAVDMVAVSRAAMDSVRPLAQTKGVALEADLGEAAGPVLGDGSRLQQVVWNLLTNAVKFTRAGGHVNLTLRSVNSHVEIEVVDDGRGIASDFLPHVFERFRQADAGSTRAHGGLGIGLTIVKNLVELHGGTITAFSDGEGRGARFLVTLPCAEAPKTDVRVMPATCGAFEQSEALSGVRLLVVEDDDDGRELLASLLRDCKASVTTADSSPCAFEILQNERFDALLSDISMPGEDGYTLIRRVRELAPEQNGQIPAVALTAYARNEDRKRALLAGFDSHIPKPIEPHELVLVLSSMIRRA